MNVMFFSHAGGLSCKAICLSLKKNKKQKEKLDPSQTRLNQLNVGIEEYKCESLS